MAEDITTRLRNYDFLRDGDHPEVWMNEAADEIERLRNALGKIEQAIVEEGKMPSYHRAVMKRHRMEWGTLHNAIEEALKVLNG
mgnify:CR=1 FL=1